MKKPTAIGTSSAVSSLRKAASLEVFSSRPEAAATMLDV